MTDVTLQVVEPDEYAQQLAAITAEAVADGGRTVIYVTTNKPYSHLETTFTENGINVDGIFFIDCISTYLGEEPDEEVDNCFFINNPENLTATSVAIDKAIKVIAGEKVLLLDSLSVLLLYNEANRVSKFANFIANKMRLQNVETVILVLESDMDNEVISQMKTVVDKVRQDG